MGSRGLLTCNYLLASLGHAGFLETGLCGAPFCGYLVFRCSPVFTGKLLTTIILAFAIFEQKPSMYTHKASLFLLTITTAFLCFHFEIASLKCGWNPEYSVGSFRVCLKNKILRSVMPPGSFNLKGKDPSGPLHSTNSWQATGNWELIEPSLSRLASTTGAAWHRHSVSAMVSVSSLVGS